MLYESAVFADRIGLVGHETVSFPVDGPMITLSIYTHLFEEACDSVMDRLDAAHRDLVRPYRGPNVVELPEQGQSQASDQGV